MHKIQLPSYIVRGRDILVHMPDFVKELGLSRASPALIVCDDITKQFTPTLEKQDVYEVLIHPISSASLQEVEVCVDLINKNQIKFVFWVRRWPPH